MHRLVDPRQTAVSDLSKLILFGGAKVRIRDAPIPIPVNPNSNSLLGIDWD